MEGKKPKPKRELVLSDKHREILDCLTEDIQNLVEKDWLKAGLTSHFTYMVNKRFHEGSSANLEDMVYVQSHIAKGIVNLWWKEQEAKALEGLVRCTKCGAMREDVEPRYSFGIYAGMLCIPCCGGYRDNCGVDQPQGNPYTDLDEQIDPD